MTDTTSRLTRAERLDRLPYTREHGKLVVGSGVGWALDAMDVGLISFVMAALAVQWSLSPTQLSWRSEEHTSELQSRQYLVCRLLLEKKKILTICHAGTSLLRGHI